MRVCPTCGHENDETATTCAQCNKRLKPLLFPVADRALEKTAGVLLFLLGVGLDLAIAFAFAAVNPVVENSCLTFLGMLVLGFLFVFAFRKKTRLFGYGMLAGALAFPIWIQIGCVPVLYYR